MLTLLLMNPARRWHLREVVRRTGCAIGTVRRELAGLVTCGVLTAARDGNRIYYQASQECPIYAELMSIIRKTSGLADVLRPALEGLGEGVEIAFIYGSQARHEAGTGSDVDLMVIGEADFGEVVAALGKVQDALGREVNPTVYPPPEFREKVSSGHPFLKTVLEEPKIFLIGSDHELGRLAK